MDGVIDEAADRRLLDATLKYVAGHADARFDAFREAMADWGEDRTDVASAHLRASDLFADALPLARRGTAERALMSLYVKERASRRWEQSYSAADAAVGADMLAGYGYTEIVGKRGPFLSERIRAGVGVFAAGVDYPAHRHRAEEIYVVLAGSGTFHLDGHPPERQVAGGVVHVPSHLVHGITVDTEPLAVLCLWRGGDLREKSTFVRAVAPGLAGRGLRRTPSGSDLRPASRRAAARRCPRATAARTGTRRGASERAARAGAPCRRGC